MTLQSKLIEAFERFGPNDALEVEQTILTYLELKNKALQLAGLITQHAPEETFIGIFAARSISAYAGLAGSVLAGKAYLPLNPKFPVARIYEMLSMVECKTLILGGGGIRLFLEFVKKYDHNLPPLTILYLPEDEARIGKEAKKLKRHKLFTADGVEAFDICPLPAALPDDYAYLLFTSGSTGHPKGIGITQKNICSYLGFILSRYEYLETDRISQAFDLTFDPSVHDIFSAWLSGACLCVVPASAVFAPSRFIREKELTVWYSVPSVPMFMERLNMLKENSFPGLRYSIFSGEALSQETALKWQKASPNALLINFYGPTEVTINITYYQWNNDASPKQCRNGCVPLGVVFPDHEIRIVDEKGQDLPAGQKGELIISGAQVAPNYINNSEKTKEVFKQFPEDPCKTWYCTGDLVEKDEEGTLFYFGRKDFQVQILGHRVELTEVEAVLKKATKTDFVIVLPWPPDVSGGRADKLVAVIGCIQDTEMEKKAVSACRETLPSYMIPAKIFFLERFPLNVNGKIDRNEILAYISHIH